MSELILANKISLLERVVFLVSLEIFVLTFCHGTVNKLPFFFNGSFKTYCCITTNRSEKSAIER